MVLDDHDDDVTAAIEQLLDEGKTWRQIAAQLGVNEAVVTAYWDRELLRRRRGTDATHDCF